MLLPEDLTEEPEDLKDEPEDLTEEPEDLTDEPEDLVDEPEERDTDPEERVLPLPERVEMSNDERETPLADERVVPAVERLTTEDLRAVPEERVTDDEAFLETPALLVAALETELLRATEALRATLLREAPPVAEKLPSRRPIVAARLGLGLMGPLPPQWDG